jgi:hypothetical protein
VIFQLEIGFGWGGDLLLFLPLGAVLGGDGLGDT